MTAGYPHFGLLRCSGRAHPLEVASGLGGLGRNLSENSSEVLLAHVGLVTILAGATRFRIGNVSDTYRGSFVR